MTPGINVDNLGTGGGTATVAGIKQIVASNATLTSGSVTLTGTGEGITVNTAAGPTIRISGAQTGVKNLYGGTDGPFSSGTVSVSALGEGLTINTAASKLQISASQTGVKNLAASNNVFSSGTVSITEAGEGITVNTAASKIQISGAQTGVKHLVASGNTFSSGTVTITGGGDISVSSSASGIIISGTQSVQTQSTGSAVSISATELPDAVALGGGSFTAATNRVALVPLRLHAHLSVDRIAIAWSMTTISTNSSGQAQVNVGLYTRNVSTLSRIGSSTAGTTWTSNSVATGDWLGYNGNRRWEVSFASSLTPGDYYVGVQFLSRVNFDGAYVGNSMPALGAATGVIGSSNTGALPFGAGVVAAAMNASIAGSSVTLSSALPWVYLYNSNQPW